jgi:hypothetical protein
MKLIIAGGRDVHLDHLDYALLDWIHAEVPVTEVVSGTASGVDTCGEMWAIGQGIPVTRFSAPWETHGKAAGHIRNRQMAEYVRGRGAVIVFPGGRGTDNMYRTACELGIPVFDRRHC